jgi:hypothetical protein
MRKKKENIVFNSERMKDEDLPEPVADAIETAREEHMEEINGENATEGLGPGYTSGEADHEPTTSVDGPIAGDAFTPPNRKRGRATKRKKGPHPSEWLEKGNHTAADSSKTL